MIDVFISMPYTDENPVVIEQRVLIAEMYYTCLLKKGKTVYSPVVNNHFLLERNDIPGTYEFWQKVCHDFISVSDEIHVIHLPGWEDSVGVQDEIKIAREYNKSILHTEVDYIHNMYYGT